MTFNINWDPKGVYVKFRGIVTAQDLIDANNYVISNGNFEDIDYQIFDFLHIDDFKVTSYDIDIVTTMDKTQLEVKEKMKIAVITQDNYVREITSEYEDSMKETGWETRIFESLEKAKNWVNE